MKQFHHRPHPHHQQIWQSHPQPQVLVHLVEARLSFRRPMAPCMKALVLDEDVYVRKGRLVVNRGRYGLPPPAMNHKMVQVCHLVLS